MLATAQRSVSFFLLQVSPVLDLFTAIMRGTPKTLSQAFISVFHQVLLPLHHTNDFGSWDRQTALLATYHESLVFCLDQFLQRDYKLVLLLLKDIVSNSWPEGMQTNTAKELLLLHEIHKVVIYMGEDIFSEIAPILLPR